MRSPVSPWLESTDGFVRSSVPKWAYQIPSNSESELAAVRRMCPADVLQVLGVK